MELSRLLRKLKPARVREVITHPDSRLQQKSSEVNFATETNLDLLVRDLVATMRKHEGVGLAAIQIGIPKRLLVFDDSEQQDNPRVLINPRLVATSTQCETNDEGCLSFPNLYAPVERAVGVTVEACDLDGNKIVVEADGLLARILQHEIDHLDGITFITHVEPKARKAALREYFHLDGTAPQKS